MSISAKPQQLLGTTGQGWANWKGLCDNTFNKKKSELCPEKCGVRICERDNLADTQVNVEGRA